jgi:hypothetical protein
VINIAKYHTLDSSKKLAEQWISSNINTDTTVGINYFYCLGENSVKQAGRNWVEDIDMTLNLDYYLFNSYCNSRFQNYYFNQNGLLQNGNLFQVHWHHGNDRILFTSSKQEIYAEFNSLIPNGYAVERIFKGQGPEMILLKKL